MLAGLVAIASFALMYTLQNSLGHIGCQWPADMCGSWFECACPPANWSAWRGLPKGAVLLSKLDDAMWRDSAAIQASLTVARATS